MSETKNVLRVENVTMQFGGVVAVDDLSMEVNEGEIVALIGPNGAGKTTAFNVITGVYAPTNGQVLFDGKKVVENHPRGKMRRQYKGKHLGDYKSVLEPTPDKLTRMGMARTFQNIRLWKSMTVFDNVLIAKHLRRSSNMFTAMFRLNAREEARLLLLDEPAAGMNPQETLELAEFIREIREKFHKTILLIEHHMDLVMGIADRIYVLDFGELIAQGTPEEIQNNARVIDAYLGVADDAED